MAAICVCFLCGIGSAAFVWDVVPRPSSVAIRVDGDLVLINAVVTDEHGTPVPNLDQGRFRLLEDGHEETIKYCMGQDGPVSIGLVLDTSRSMGDTLDAVKKAAIRFINTGNPSDEYFLLAFRNQPQIIVPFTSDADRLMLAIGSVDAGGSTALLDALYLAMQEVRRGKYPRKALLVLSDEIDNHSRYSKQETRRLAQEADYPVYAMNLWQPPRSGNRYAIQRQDPGLLEEIARPTGGRTLTVRELRRLIPTAELISAEIRHEYVLAYTPSNRQMDGKLRHVRLRVDPTEVHHFKVSYRSAYRAPLQ